MALPHRHGVTWRVDNDGPHAIAGDPIQHSGEASARRQYRKHWKLGTKPRLVMEFALEAVSRRSEVARLGPQHVKVVANKRRLKIERCHGSNDVDILMTQAVQDAVDAMPAATVVDINGTKTFITTERGKQYSPDGLARDFAKWVTAAGLPDCCRPHGLKRSAMSRFAGNGAQMMGASGHKTLAMVQLYADEADRIKLADAAFEKLEGKAAG